MARGDDEDQKRRIPVGLAEAEAPSFAVAADDPANKEAAQLSSGAPIRDLEREAKEREHERGQKFKDHFERIAVVILYGLAIGFGLLTTIWFWHLVMPEHPIRIATQWGTISIGPWLSEAKLSKAEGVLTGGIIAGLVADHFKRRMDR